MTLAERNFPIPTNDPTNNHNQIPKKSKVVARAGAAAVGVVLVVGATLGIKSWTGNKASAAPATPDNKPSAVAPLVPGTTSSSESVAVAPVVSVESSKPVATTSASVETTSRQAPQTSSAAETTAATSPTVVGVETATPQLERQWNEQLYDTMPLIFTADAEQDPAAAIKTSCEKDFSAAMNGPQMPLQPLAYGSEAQNEWTEITGDVFFNTNYKKASPDAVSGYANDLQLGANGQLSKTTTPHDYERSCTPLGPVVSERNSKGLLVITQMVNVKTTAIPAGGTEADRMVVPQQSADQYTYGLVSEMKNLPIGGNGDSAMVDVMGFDNIRSQSPPLYDK